MKPILIFVIAYLTFLSYNFDKAKILNETTKKCNAELTVEKNRHVKSIYSSDGVSFTLELANKSSNAATYRLYTRKTKEACGNNAYNSSSPKNKAANNNIDLEASFSFGSTTNKTLGKPSKNEIMLRGGETRKFIVTLKADKNTDYYSWGCVEVIADSKDCESSSVKTYLSVYVPDPNDK